MENKFDNYHKQFNEITSDRRSRISVLVDECFNLPEVGGNVQKLKD
jgi:hypothetical protein